MKILLILAHSNPKNYFLYRFASSAIQPSLTLHQLAAITPEDHTVELKDMRFQKIDYNWKVDIVGISSLTYAIDKAYEVADEFRRRGKTVVFGGYHASALPDEAKQHADAVVVGEAEEAWPKLLKDHENGKLKSHYHSRPVDPKNIPFADRNNQNNIISLVSRIQATRGCPNRCDFCSVSNIETNKFRKRPIENVIEEIKSLKTKSFSFDDSSLTIDVEYSKNLFREMKGLNKKFSCYGNINVLNRDEELVKLSKAAGCHTWCIGFESISQKNLDKSNKNNQVKIYDESIKMIHRNKIQIKGLFMFGFDEDTTDIFEATYKKIRQWNLAFAYFSILTPFPGSKLYLRLKEEGRILTEKWSKYTCGYVVYEPKKITKEYLFNKTNDLAKNFYSHSNIISRSFNYSNKGISNFTSNLLSNNIDKTYVKMRMNYYQ
jgi:radical SAM superfamily enzyme YgiQ (UPF0313 family)